MRVCKSTNIKKIWPYHHFNLCQFLQLVHFCHLAGITISSYINIQSWYMKCIDLNGDVTRQRIMMSRDWTWWLPSERNASDLFNCACFLHSMKICMWFLYHFQNYYFWQSTCADPESETGGTYCLPAGKAYVRL